MKQLVPLRIHCSSEIDLEIRGIVISMFPNFDFSDYQRAFADAQRLFDGRMAGFHACDTAYHDWSHTLDVLLATARLLHGIHLVRQELSPRIVGLALVAALFHDSGYLRRKDETGCTGARFTLTHVSRGIDLLEDYANDRGWPVADLLDMESMIRCTDMGSPVESLVHTNIETMLAAHALATADIVSQMADDLYLEKLALLFGEFAEAGISEYTSEYDMASRVKGFQALMRVRLENTLSNIIGCVGAHFKQRFDVERDIYSEAIMRNMQYLGTLLEQHGREYRRGLRRSLSRRSHPTLIAA
jgi:hypothetical protein